MVTSLVVRLRGYLSDRVQAAYRQGFEHVAATGERLIVLGAGGDFMMANAVKDGLVQDEKSEGAYGLTVQKGGYQKVFPMQFVFYVTDADLEFVKKYVEGRDIA